MKVLVVCYSRTGHTRTLARQLATALGGDLEEITDRANRRGPIGYLRSGREGWLGKRTEIVPSAVDRSAYDLVVIGTPVWSGSLSSPVRAYLEDHGKELRAVAFFCTMGGRGSSRTFRQMQALGGPPLATLARTERQLASADLPAAIAAFASQLGAAMARTPSQPTPASLSSPAQLAER